MKDLLVTGNLDFGIGDEFIPPVLFVPARIFARFGSLPTVIQL